MSRSRLAPGKHTKSITIHSNLTRAAGTGVSGHFLKKSPPNAETLPRLPRAARSNPRRWQQGISPLPPLGAGKNFRLRLQPVFQVLADGLARGLPKLPSPLDDFVATDFVLALILLIRRWAQISFWRGRGD